MSARVILTGDCVEQMRQLDENSIDAVVCDPPYGIGFMGHEWDQPGEFGAIRANGDPAPFASGRAYPGKHIAGGREGVPSGQRRARNPAPSGLTRDGGAHGKAAMDAGRYDLSLTANRRFQGWCEAWASEVLRVLKPGGHLVSFGGTRTYHRLTCAVEDAGFEVRDSLIWLYGSGFPKSHNGEWGGTALKPGHEPIVLARKPLVGTVAENWEQHGTGALNINGCRIEGPKGDGNWDHQDLGKSSPFIAHQADESPTEQHDAGRWPANVITDEDAAAELDAQSGELTSGANPTRRSSDKFRDTYGDFKGQEECDPARGAESGGASRFFYSAKASGAERNAGLEGTEKAARNAHPTVKPISLMRWLVRLVTPGGGLVLDPFTGSGTTGIATVLEGLDFLGIEREPEYVEIAEVRIAFWERNRDRAAEILKVTAKSEREHQVHADAGQLGLLEGAA